MITPDQSHRLVALNLLHRLEQALGLGDPFELQDRLVERVVGAIAPQLEKAEMDRAKRELTSNPAAYDLYLRGLASWNRWSKDDNANALTFFYAAIEKDPEFATPYGLAASCYQFAKANGWQRNFDREEISHLTERAVELGSDDAVALCWGGHVRAFFFEEVQRALLLIDRALELAPAQPSSRIPLHPPLRNPLLHQTASRRSRASRGTRGPPCTGTVLCRLPMHALLAARALMGGQPAGRDGYRCPLGATGARVSRA